LRKQRAIDGTEGLRGSRGAVERTEVVEGTWIAEGPEENLLLAIIAPCLSR
jgi:hypothetical protein